LTERSTLRATCAARWLSARANPNPDANPNPNPDANPNPNPNPNPKHGPNPNPNPPLTLTLTLSLVPNPHQVNRADAYKNGDANTLSHDRAGLLSMSRGGGAFEFGLTPAANTALDVAGPRSTNQPRLPRHPAICS
jgi:hypothetical protein